MKFIKSMLVIFVLPIWHSVGFAQNPPCLNYEPAEVQVVGILKRDEFAGPPNFESIKRGDALDVYWLLHLARPICVKPVSSTDTLNELKSGVMSVQLVLSDYKRYKSMLGKRVKISGTLFAAHTGHHHAEVLIQVVNIVLDPARI